MKLAHRTYMNAMSKYKLLRYGVPKVDELNDSINTKKAERIDLTSIGENDEGDNRKADYFEKKDDKEELVSWGTVDQDFIRCIQLYKQPILCFNRYHMQLGKTDSEINKPEEEEQQYEEALLNVCREGQPIFIDIIFKIILHRVYVNIRDRKLLTAESILHNARDLIKHFAGRKPYYRIVFDKALRANARPYDFVTLEKKYLMMQGILAQSLSK
jgi:hypothetical protein